MVNDENTDLLLGLGLSLNQARVYLAILKLEKNKSDERLTGMRSMVQKLSLKDWKQPPLGEESIYILIAEKKAILAKTSELIRNSRKEVALIADKARIMPVLAQFSDEYRLAKKKGAQIRLLLEGENPDGLLKEKGKKIIEGGWG